MFHVPEPPVTAFATDRPRRWFPLKPVVDTHVQESQRLILAASACVQPGQALVLGAGRCDEIPLGELAGRFQQVILNDMHSALLTEALTQAGLTRDQAAKVRLQVADLTGLTDAFLRRCGECLDQAGNPATALDALTQIAEAAQPAPLTHPTRYDLLVASCVLSQLHVVACNRVLRLFGTKFPGQESLVRASEPWTRALYSLARRMEDAFVTGLFELLAPGGRIYLSDTVHVCLTQLLPQGQWVTDGSYLMTRTAQLTDYLDDRFRVEHQARWAWVAEPPLASGRVGRLFAVQGLVLSAR